MGSGKTTVGRAAARRLGWRFVDTDRQVEARTGRTVEEIWKSDGEPGFRQMEADALVAAMASTDAAPAVIAAGGGIVLDPRNRTLLQAHPPVVWLRATGATLAQRVGSGAGRPLLADDPSRALRRLSAERRALYEEVASTVIDVDQLSREEVVELVVEAARR